MKKFYFFRKYALSFTISLILLPSIYIQANITDITLTPSEVNENADLNSPVGTLNTVDPDIIAFPYTYFLVDDFDWPDNNNFEIDEDKLVTKTDIDFETKDSYQIRVRSIDNLGASFDKTLTINVIDVNEQPTAIILSNDKVAENLGPGAIIGEFSTEDPDADETFTYTLVSGDGDTDNGRFDISSSSLITNETFNYEVNQTYSIRVRSFDGEYYIEKVFIINITDINDSPTNISLFPSTIAENQPENTVVGTFTTSDEDAGDSHTYTFAVGSGDADNASFNIMGSQLAAAVSFNFEYQQTYSVLIQSTDVGGYTIQKQFTIEVTDANDTPSDITLSSSSINENQPAGSTVGELSSTDQDQDETFTYTLVTGSGDTDNGSFNISGNLLRSSVEFNYEVKTSYSIRIRTTDSQGSYYEEPFTVTVNNINESPVDISLSPSTLAENMPANTIVGDFTTTDPDLPDSHTYTLVAGTGDTDNGSFNILNNQLRTNSLFDFEVKSSFSVRIQSTDGGGNSFQKQLIINVTDANDAPSNISLAPSSILENQSAGSTVGELSSTDQDPLETFTYSLVTGSGSDDNSSFNISGNTLISNAVFNYEVKSSYSVRIRTTDSEGSYYEKIFSVTISNENEQPVDISLSPSTIAENQPANTVIGNFTTTDPDLSDSYTYTLITGTGDTDNSSFNISGSQLRTNSSFDYETKSVYSIRVQSTDGGGNSVQKQFTVTVIDVNEGSGSLNGGGTYCYGAIMPLTLTIVGGDDPFTVTLRRSASSSNKDTIISGITTLSYIIYVKVPGTYAIYDLRDEAGNSMAFSNSPVTLVINPKAKATIGPLNSEVCKDGSSKATLNVNFTAGVSPWTVKIRRGSSDLYDTTFTAVTQDPFYFDARVIANAPTEHRIIEIKDANGCIGDNESGTATVTYKAPYATAVLSGGGTVCEGTKSTITFNLTGTAPWIVKYLRNGGNEVTLSGIQSAVLPIEVTQDGTYTLSYVRDANCTGLVSGSATVTFLPKPTAVISGNYTICEHTSTNLSVTLTGNSPWKFYYTRNMGDSILVNPVSSSPWLIPVSKQGTYSLYKVSDNNGCVGTVSGTGVINITAAPEVEITGLDPAYNKDVVRVPIYGNPSGGSYNPHNALILYGGIMHFWPVVAGVGTHTIIYNYQDAGTHCFGHDTVVVRVLEAQATINFEDDRTNYCTNDGPFEILGVNIKNVIGSFSISGGVGLIDHGDNTATIYPTQLGANNYTITYTYFDGTPLSVQSSFNIGNKPVAAFTWATECYQPGQSISFKNSSTSPFGYFTDTSYYWKVYKEVGYTSYETRDITHTFPAHGNHTVELQINNSFGCVDTLKKTFPLRPTIDLNDDYYESFDSKPISWRAGTNSVVNSWKISKPTSGFSLDPSDANCWYTQITNTSTPPVEHSWVSSPCFNFTNAQKPMIKMNIWRLFHSNANTNGANLQATVDSGKTWILIGQINDGIRWYNSYEITGLPGDKAIGWSNVRDAGWGESRHSLDVLKGKSKVQFRIYYGSDSYTRNTNGIAFDDVSILDRSRMALIEHFTNSSHSSTPKADSILDAFVKEYSANVIDLQYHTSNPANDPFYAHNNLVPTTRQFYYGLSTVPYALLDGGTTSQHKFDYIEGSKPLDKNVILIESLQDSKFEINLNSQVENNILNTKAQISARINIPLTKVAVRVAVVERVIHGVTGANQDTVFRSVVKNMLPGPAGTIVNRAWNKDEIIEVENSWNLANIYDQRELRIVAFIQNETTKEIYQAAIDTIGSIITDIDDPFDNENDFSFEVYPNPANTTINIHFNQDLYNETTVQLYNNTGMLVYSANHTKGTPISVEEFSNGIYLLRLLSEDKILGTRKLIISK